MDALFWFNVFTRWLHVTSAVIGVGALIFLALALYPALVAQEAATRQAVMAQVLPRVRTIVHSALGLLLLTGVYNFVVVLPKVRTLSAPSFYHSIIGTKILLALVLFGTLSAMLSSSPASDNMQERRSRWLTVSLILALVVLLFSATLRRLWDDRPVPTNEQPVIQSLPGDR